MGYFWTVLKKKFLQKLPKYWAPFWSTLKMSHLSKNCCDHFWKTLGYFSFQNLVTLKQTTLQKIIISRVSSHITKGRCCSCRRSGRQAGLHRHVQSPRNAPRLSSTKETVPSWCTCRQSATTCKCRCKTWPGSSGNNIAKLFDCR